MTTRFLSLLLPAVALVGVLPYTYLDLSSDAIAWLFRAPVLLLLLVFALKARLWLSGGYFGVTIYLSWVASSLFLGSYVADGYWDWKSLTTNASALLLAMAAYSSAEPEQVAKLLRSFVYFVVPTFVLLLPFMWRDAWGFYLAVMPILILAIPYLGLRSRVLVVCLSLAVIFGDVAARSNVLKFAVPYAILCLWFLPRWMQRKFAKGTQLTLAAAPVVLFVLAVSGIFNIFQIKDYLDWEHGEIVAVEAGENSYVDLRADTRTFLYEEVLSSAIARDSWIFGRTPAKGYDTFAFADVYKISGKTERPSSEVAVLNVFLWLGLIGVILYALMFFWASWKAISRSKNTYCVLLGVFVAFRWAFAWVEDGTFFNLTYLSLWMMLGICMSNKFLSMSDVEMRAWLRGLFTSDRRRRTRERAQSVARVA